MDKSPILIGSDHAGFDLKEKIKQELTDLGIPSKDIGVHDGTKSVDYPIYAAKIAGAVSTKLYSRGIIVGGSGIGASIVCNRFPKVRAALCNTMELAHLARAHNDANVLVLGGRSIPIELGTQIVREWISTDFEGGRHSRRVQLIDDEMRLRIAFGHLNEVDPQKLESVRIERRIIEMAGKGFDAVKKLFGTDRRDEDKQRLPESCPTKITSGDTEYDALMVNLSSGGAQFKVEETTKVDIREFTLDDEIRLSIKTPYGVAQSKGTAKWADQETRTFGVEFTEVSEDPKDPLRLLMDSTL